MSARKARRATQQGAGSNGHRHSNQPSREQLHRENERLLRENEDLRGKVAEREKQLADAEKRIADLERQLAEKELDQLFQTTFFGRTCWRAETARPKAQEQAETGCPARTPGASSTIASRN